MGGQQAERKFDFQTIQPFNSSSSKANKAEQTKTDNVNVNDVNSHMPDYFRPSMNKEGDKKAGIHTKNTQ